MAIKQYKDGQYRDIGRIYHRVGDNFKPLSVVYQYVGGVFVAIYTAIRSCFGSGMWTGQKPWIGTDAWKSK